MAAANILDRIVAQKNREIEQLYAQHSLDALRSTTLPSPYDFYRTLGAARAAGQPFFITEFKRKSPSEGWINRDADLPAQVEAYLQSGAGAISVLTDGTFFGGSYDDLRLAADTLQRLSPTVNRPLLLQKDFILDPIQIYLARHCGADIILLIAAILDPARLEFLRKTAETLGMGVLVEVHDREELEKVKHLDFPVLGVNNRDLKTFRTALNRVNVLAPLAGGRFLIAESGIQDYRDFQVVKRAAGFLIGAGLMRGRHIQSADMNVRPTGLEDFFQTQGTALFKACGLRNLDHLRNCPADFIGINFSPQSKRRIPADLLDSQPLPPQAVAVFYQNSEAEIREVLTRYPFKIVQLYADDVTPDFVRSLRQKVFLACRVHQTADLQQLEKFAADVDLFILDGAVPGSGQPIGTAIPTDFPHPFLLAGGLHAGNLDRILLYQNCLGADIASGLETAGLVDSNKMDALALALSTIRTQKDGAMAARS